MAVDADNLFDLPRLRVSFGFEVILRTCLPSDGALTAAAERYAVPQVRRQRSGYVLAPIPTSLSRTSWPDGSFVCPLHLLSPFLTPRVAAEFFDVKFCPFQPLDCDPVFAAVSKKHVSRARCSSPSPHATE